VGSPAAPVSPPARTSRRVYTIALLVIVVLALVSVTVFTRAPAPDAHDRVTIEPVMTKGPTTAAVTIVEFSDYQ
jgi:hypothetical protein